MPASCFRDCCSCTFDGLFVASITRVLPPGGGDFNAPVMVILVGAAFQGCSCVVAFCTPAVELAELDDEPDAADALEELLEPQAARATAATMAVMPAAALIIRGRCRLSVFAGCCISLLCVSLLANGDLVPAGQLGPEPVRDDAVAPGAATASASSSPGPADPGSPPGGVGPPRRTLALTRCARTDGERLIESATATIRATPLYMSLSQLAPDTSCSPCTP